MKLNYNHYLFLLIWGLSIFFSCQKSEESNFNNFHRFNGTSSAAPFVSGVAALILSEYPNLTYNQVNRSIQLGCAKVGSYSYTTDGKYPAGSRNNEVGYGLVDAYEALRKAAQYQRWNELDSIPGFDYIITNRSSQFIDEIYVQLVGTIYGSTTYLITSDPGGVYSGEEAGYPIYRGENVHGIPGSSI